MISNLYHRWRMSVYWKTDRIVKKTVLDLLEENASARVIDCGSGGFSLIKEVGAKARTDKLYALDIIPLPEQLAQEERIKTLISDLNESISLDDNFIDVLIANQVIEHLVNTDQFIRESWRVLKPGGYAIITTPNLASAHAIFFLLLGFQPFTAAVSDEFRAGNPFWDQSRPWQSNPPFHTHLRHFTWNALSEIFEHHGFKVEELKGVGYFPFSGKAAALMSQINGKHAANLVIKVRKPLTEI